MFIQNFLTGFVYPFKGLKFLLKNPTLYKYILIHTLITIVVFASVIGLGVYIGIEYGVPWIESLQLWDNIIWTISEYILLVILFVFITVLSIVIAVLFSSAFSTITCDKLSSKTEEILTGKTGDVQLSFKENLIKTIKEIILSIIRSILLLFKMILLLIINFIPILGSILYIVIAFVFSAKDITVEYLDYPLDRRNIKDENKKLLYKNNKGYYYGFGTAILLITLIPVLNLILISISTVGATLMYLNEIESKNEAID